MISREGEASALLPRQPRLSPIHQAIQTLASGGNRALRIFDRVVTAINALALGQAPLYTLLAWPSVESLANRAISPVSLAICYLKLASNIAKEKKFEFTIRNRNIKMEEVDHIFSAAITSTNTYYFFLGSYIAAYIAADALIKGITLQAVYVSNLAYLLCFVLVSSLVATTHGVLEFYKKNWENSQTTGGKILRHSHHAVSTLYNASNINSFIMLGLTTFWGISESGSINPYDRLGLFLETFAMGLLLVLLSANVKATAKYIEQLINLICAVTYVATAINQDQPLKNLFIGGFSVIAFSAIVAEFFLKPQQTHVRRDVENALPVTVTDAPSSPRSALSMFRPSEPLEIITGAQPILSINNAP